MASYFQDLCTELLNMRSYSIMQMRLEEVLDDTSLFSEADLSCICLMQQHRRLDEIYRDCHIALGDTEKAAQLQAWLDRPKRTINIEE